MVTGQTRPQLSSATTRQHSPPAALTPGAGGVGVAAPRSGRRHGGMPDGGLGNAVPRGVSAFPASARSPWAAHRC